MNTMILGLTGSIATGKSTVSSFFRKMKIPVIDADVVARQVTSPNSVALLQIKNHFGDDAINDDGTMNRNYIAKQVFSDPAELATLNKITAPLIRAGIIEQLEKYKTQSAKLVVLDMPLLYEQHYENIVDQVMVVYTTEELQLQRLMKRNSLTIEAAKQRIAAQIKIKQKVQLADVVIDNSGSVAETNQQVVKWLEDQSFRNEE